MNIRRNCLRNNTVAVQTTHSTRIRKKSDRRYLLGIGIFAFAFTGLIGFSFGGLTTEVGAREESFSLRMTLQELLNGGRQRPTQQQPRQPQQTEQIQQQAPVTPQVTETVTPVQAPVTPEQPQAPTQVVQSVQSTPVEAAPVDTAPQIALTTSTQAQATSEAVTYTSQQISTTTRDRLLLAATIGLVAGIVLLILSLTLPKSEAFAQAKPIRIKIPVREASTQ